MVFYGVSGVCVYVTACAIGGRIFAGVGLLGERQMVQLHVLIWKHGFETMCTLILQQQFLYKSKILVRCLGDYGLI